MFAEAPHPADSARAVAGPAAEAPPTDIDVQVVDTAEKLDALVGALDQAEVIAFDTETTSTDEMEAELVGISLAVREGQGYYIPLAHLAGQNLPVEQVIGALRGPMSNPRIPKVGHHAKYDYIVLRRHGLTVTPLGFDTMIAEFVVDPGSRNLGLKNLAVRAPGTGDAAHRAADRHREAPAEHGRGGH